jgi:uncharacterized protein YndB with AHSA1/START domain
MPGLVAEAEVRIDAPRSNVWSALVSRDALKEFMFGSDVTSGWQVGDPITWEGEWEGRRYRDKGEVLEATPGEHLVYTHFSPLAGKPDLPENYHTVSIRLADDAGATLVRLSQDGNADEDARRHSEDNWRQMLAALKEYVERAA